MSLTVFLFLTALIVNGTAMKANKAMRAKIFTFRFYKDLQTNQLLNNVQT